ncbi:MAG: hypothetical protein R2879_12040 [Saprospiraceae bacterium]
MEHHQIKVEKTAHVFTRGSKDGSASCLIIAFHGYGQLAKYFLRKFDFLSEEKYLVVAPEGLSRYYTKGFYGDVGASWMTKEDRLVEIDDYSEYLSKILDHFKGMAKPECKIILFGFSQGCATIMRWVMKKFPKVDGIVLYGGLLPEDLVYTPHKEYFNQLDLKWAFGNEDIFLNEDRINWHLNFIKEQHLDFQVIPYDGGHEMIRSVMKERLIPA